MDRGTRKNVVAAVVLFTFSFWLVPHSVLSVDDNIYFNRDIRSLLSDNCFKCHGPDEADRQAGLRLDNEQGILAAEDVIAPGETDQSEFLRRILSDDEDEVMPPADSGRSLSPEQKALFRRWIEQGAKWENHWSFTTPKKIPPPTVSSDWGRNEIDAFIYDKLIGHQLTPNEIADRNSLIRRVSLDLTGLPPDPKIVKQFVTSRSVRWYEELVELLLRSPHYGEHMGRYWLDAARYADTHGLHLDNYREMWLYRDWVVKAFNDNMPFDEFLVEQLAGDLLESPTESQLIATGFNRAHVTTNEGGSITEEVLVRNVVDRVATTGTVFMGLTIACAQCHDHKYDPITQKDFYSLYAFFNSLDANPMDGNNKEHAPSLRYFDEEQKQELEIAKRKRDQLNDQVDRIIAEYDYVDSQASEDVSASDTPSTREPIEVAWLTDDLPEGSKKTGKWKRVDANELKPFTGDHSFLDNNKEFSQIYFLQANTGLRFKSADKLFAYVYLDPDNPPREIMLQFNNGVWEHRAYWGENLINFGKDKTPSRIRLGDLPEPGKWTRLEVTAKEVGFNDASTIHGLALSQYGGKVYWDSAGAVTTLPQTYDGDSLIAWKQFQIDTAGVDLPQNLRKRLLSLHEKKLKDDKGDEENNAPSDSKTADDESNTDSSAENEKLASELKDYFLRKVYPTTATMISPHLKKRDALNKKITEITNMAPTTLIWREKQKPVEAFILDRGEYDHKGEPVSRNTPASLPPFPESEPRDRLGLAHWLISKEHPLTARVAVNRIWQQFFGVGIVATAEDFGSQGDPPSHPELLDWLAVDFVNSQWDIKSLVKKIVMSSTYRQSTVATPEKLKFDQQNLLLSRGPRYRLDAEMLRDQALSVSGLLVPALGGPGVKPPQPDGLWFAVGYTRSNTVRFSRDKGPDKVHRRSLYTFWKRTSPPPQMSTFDAPTRESCSVRRERTNTPLQALMMMNDPQYVEAARVLAQQTLDQQFASLDDDIKFMYQRAMAKPLPDQMLDLLRENFESNKFEFTRKPEKARNLIAIGEAPADEKYDAIRLASMTMLANLLMNQDEFVSKN